MINEYFKMLGHKVRSLITGEEGIVVSVSFDLNGCVQACDESWIRQRGQAPGVRMARYKVIGDIGRASRIQTARFR